MQLKIIATLLLSLTILAGCHSLARINGPTAQQTSTPPSQSARALTPEEIRDLCDRVSEIKVFPMKERRGRDSTYDRFMEVGIPLVPCLIEKVTDETPMPDPREAPKYDEVRVGDVAYFLIIDITHLDFIALLPPQVQAKYKDQGVYAYFEYVEKHEHRKKLQESLRSWYRETWQ